MKTLHVIVSNKKATFLQRDGGIVCGNSDYQIEFHFDSAWDAYPTKTARFIWNGKHKDIEFPGSVCPVPIVADTEQLEVGVYVEGTEDLRTSTSAIIPCTRSILCKSSKTTSDGTVVIPEGTPVLIEKTITENGEHLPGNGADGFSKVIVRVAPNIQPLTITENGTYPASGDVDGYSPIIVNVPTEGGGSTSVGEWSPETNAYNPGDLVTYKGVYYICIKALSIGAVMNNPEADTDSWARLSIVGEWSPETTAYNIGDIVTYNGVYYICIKALPIGAVMNAPDVDTDSWERVNGTVVVEGIDTCTMEYISGGNPLGIIYSNGIETKTWADTPVGERITVACNTPIVFYYPMGDEAPSVTLTAANGTTIEPYYSTSYKRIYSIPSEYKNTYISVSW